eukprot:SM000024S07751  [mRNA]  locus=s24:211942:214961:- [translate_table: standard]
MRAYPSAYDLLDLQRGEAQLARQQVPEGEAACLHSALCKLLRLAKDAPQRHGTARQSAHKEDP